MKRLFLLSVALLTVWAAAAQVRFVDATTLNLIGKAQPTSQPYHRIDTVVYKGFTKSENQQVRCSAGRAGLQDQLFAYRPLARVHLVRL